MMPHMSGEQFIKHVRSHQDSMPSPLCALCARDTPARPVIARRVFRSIWSNPSSRGIAVRWPIFLHETSPPGTPAGVTTQNQNLEHLAKEAACKNVRISRHWKHSSKPRTPGSRESVQRNFVAMVGREFRTPLTIFWLYDLMRKQTFSRRRSRSIPPISMCSERLSRSCRSARPGAVTKFPAPL